MTDRAVDIRISAATETGWCIWEAGHVVAALTSRAEVAEWVERRLGAVPGEIEREVADREQVREELPNMLRAANAEQQAEPTTVVRRMWGRS